MARVAVQGLGLLAWTPPRNSPQSQECQVTQQPVSHSHASLCMATAIEIATHTRSCDRSTFAWLLLIARIVFHGLSWRHSLNPLKSPASEPEDGTWPPIVPNGALGPTQRPRTPNSAIRLNVRLSPPPHQGQVFTLPVSATMESPCRLGSFGKRFSRRRFFRIFGSMSLAEQATWRSSKFLRIN